MTTVTGHTTRRRTRRGLLAVGLAGTLAVVGTGHAAADDDLTEQEPPAPPEGGVTAQLLHESVRVFEPTDHVRVFDPTEYVESLGDGIETMEGETTITLSTDLLFAENSWELPASAPSRIASLVGDIPDGASVAVTGHTDTQQPIGHEFDNQELSERRAEAVADVLREERPDLTLDVSGVGESQPAVTPDPEDPSTHAANRRVEIVYTG